MAIRFTDNSCGDVFRHPALVVADMSITNRTGKVYSQPLDAIIDTGADRSVVPAFVVQQLADLPCDHKKAKLADRSRPPEPHPMHLLWFATPGFPELCLEVFAMSRPNVIIGRDWLSQQGAMLLGDFGARRCTLSRHSAWRGLILRALGL